MYCNMCFSACNLFAVCANIAMEQFSSIIQHSILQYHYKMPTYVVNVHAVLVPCIKVLLLNTCMHFAGVNG